MVQSKDNQINRVNKQIEIIKNMFNTLESSLLNKLKSTEKDNKDLKQ